MTLSEQIDEIMDWFDFKKVWTAMEALNWRWVRGAGFYRPTEPDLRRQARVLLNLAKDSPSGCCSSGGFVAERVDDCMSLQFVVAEWACEPEEAGSNTPSLPETES